jgi:hypothetical protein
MICVERWVNGELVILPLVDQGRFEEWPGCFYLVFFLKGE